MHRWRQYTAYFPLQNTRHYTPSLHFRASKPQRKTKCLNNSSPPAKFRPYAPRVSRAPQTNGLRRQPLFKFTWLDWAKNHKSIVVCFFMFGCPIILFSCTSQRVPITGRRRLDYVPNWLGTCFETMERELEGEWMKENTHLGSESPVMQEPTSIFNTLLCANGLDDREWELRVFYAPGMQAIAYSHLNVCALTNSSRRTAK